MVNKIIAISGKQFSGKDTVAKILLDLLPEFKRVGIGDAIKIEYGKRTGLSVEEIEKNKAQYRADLIALGDEGRAISDDFWLKKVLETEGNIIITDMRKKTELAIFKQHRVYTIRVECSKELRAQRGTLVKDDDPSETDLDDIKDWNFIIHNDSDYEKLVEKSKELAKEVMDIL